MAQTEHLPIYKGAYDLCLYLEKAARGFSRYHKYTLGTDLRDGARRALKLIVRANARRDKAPVLLEVREEVEQLKVVLRLGQDVQAFSSFNSFAHAITQVVAIAKQNEGWLKHQRQGHGQSRRAMPEGRAAPGVPQTLVLSHTLVCAGFLITKGRTSRPTTVATGVPLRRAPIMNTGRRAAGVTSRMCPAGFAVRARLELHAALRCGDDACARPPRLTVRLRHIGAVGTLFHVFLVRCGVCHLRVVIFPYALSLDPGESVGLGSKQAYRRSCASE